MVIVPLEFTGRRKGIAYISVKYHTVVIKYNLYTDSFPPPGEVNVLVSGKATNGSSPFDRWILKGFVVGLGIDFGIPNCSCRFGFHCFRRQFGLVRFCAGSGGGQGAWGCPGPQRTEFKDSPQKPIDSKIPEGFNFEDELFEKISIFSHQLKFYRP